MADIIRDSSLGQVIRYVTGNRYLRYADERPEFRLPAPVVEERIRRKLDEVELREEREQEQELKEQEAEQGESGPRGQEEEEKKIEPEQEPEPEQKGQDIEPEHKEQDAEIEKLDTLSRSSSSSSQSTDLERAETHELRPYFSRTSRAEALGPLHTVSRPIQPTLTSDGTILVDWYSTDDADNPMNWSTAKRTFVATQILLYTFAVYMGSSIFAPSIPGVIAHFGVGETAASLGLALYVLGYGIGPMLFSPLSEMPLVGRNPPYIATFAIFVVLTIPGALTNSFAGLLIVRFLLGVFGSPSLATGPATLQDMFPLIKVPYLLSLWAAAATLGPALAPVIGGFSVQAMGWRWSAWEMLWMAAPIFLLMFVSLPETSASNILLRRARRLRRVLGNDKLKSQSEIDQAHMTIGKITYDALLIPWKINLLDPAVAFSTFYTALLYSCYYSFFESFPLVYTAMYGFNLGESSLPFLSILVALLIVLPLYLLHFYLTVERPFLSGSDSAFGPPERRLIPGLFGTYLIPIGLFLFAWSATPSVHWIVPTIGAGLSVAGTYIVFQSIFLYLPFTYPQYSASLFAANDFARSTLAAAAIMFSRPLFLALGVNWGVSLLAFLTIACTAGIYVLFFWGESMRGRSKFAAK